MANTQAAATMWNAPNYVGELFLIGANQTPFLNMIGGLQGGRHRTVSDWRFALAQPYALESASQPSISETASLTAPTAWTYVRAQDTNQCQIFQRKISVSYAKQSATGSLGAQTTVLVEGSGGQPVMDEVDFQISAHLEQIAINAEYTFLNGTGVVASSASVAFKTQGIVGACSTNTVAAGSVRLSKALMNQILRTMAANGARFRNPVIFCNAFQKQMLSDIYGYAPADRNVGGVNIKQIETDFAMLGIVWAPQMDTAKLLIADVGFCQPVFMPTPKKGLLFYEELAKNGAGTNGQLYGQMGLDYGPEEYHGTITGLATS